MNNIVDTRLLNKIAASSTEVEPPKFNPPIGGSKPTFTQLTKPSKDGILKATERGMSKRYSLASPINTKYSPINPKPDQFWGGTKQNPNDVINKKKYEAFQNRLDNAKEGAKLGKVSPNAPTTLPKENNALKYTKPIENPTTPKAAPKGELGMMFDDKRRTLKSGSGTLKAKNPEGFYAGVGEKAITERQRANKPKPTGELGMNFDNKKRNLKSGNGTLRPKNKDGFYAGIGEKAITERQRAKELEIPEFFKKTKTNPSSLKSGDKTFRVKGEGLGKNKAQQTAKKITQEATKEGAKKSAKPIAEVVKTPKKLGKGGKLGLAGLGVGLAAGGAKALYDKNKQKKEEEQMKSASNMLDELYMEKQANLLSNIGNTLGTAARNGNVISTVKNGLNNGAKAFGNAMNNGAIGQQAKQIGNSFNKFQKPLAGVGAAGAFGPLGMVAGLAGLRKMADENIEEIEKSAGFLTPSGVRKKDIPGTRRKDKKQAKKYYKKLSKEGKRKFLNEAHRIKADIYNEHSDRNGDVMKPTLLAMAPAVAGAFIPPNASKTARNVKNGLLAAEIGLTAKGITPYFKDSRATEYSKVKAMQNMQNKNQDKKADMYDSDMEKQAIAFSGVKARNIPRVKRKDKKQDKKYLKALAPQDKRNLVSQAEKDSLKYYDAYDFNRDSKGNKLLTASIIGSPLGIPGLYATDLKKAKAYNKALHEGIRARQRKQANENIEGIEKEAFAFSGVKHKDLAYENNGIRNKKDAQREVESYIGSLTPEEKEKFYDRQAKSKEKIYGKDSLKKDLIGNGLAAAPAMIPAVAKHINGVAALPAVVGYYGGVAGLIAAGKKNARANNISRNETMKAMKSEAKQNKEASMLLDGLYKEAALSGGVSGLANNTNPSPFAKATVKGMGESVATSMSPTPNVTSGATSVKAPTSMSTGDSNVKQAEEVIDSFEKMLEKTASDFLPLSEDELQAPVSETMAIRRQYRELFNSSNINW